LGVDKGKEELRELRKRLEKGFKEIGLKDEPGEESKFSPHMTIGRWNDVYVKSLQVNLTSR
jgi:2'-5' RNA ligase